MKTNQIPKEIEAILIKGHEGKKVTDDEKLKLRTYLGTIQASIHHPVNGKEIPNPEPLEVDVSLRRPETLEDRVKRIMSVSSRIAKMKGFETAEEADDFDVEDAFDAPGPISPFEMVDHFADMEPERPLPLKESSPPGSRPESEAEPSATPEGATEPE